MSLLGLPRGSNLFVCISFEGVKFEVKNWWEHLISNILITPSSRLIPSHSGDIFTIFIYALPATNPPNNL